MQPEKLLGIVATAVVVGAVIAGLLLIEGPGTARTTRFDQERINDLNALAGIIDEYHRVNGSMPDDLTAIENEYGFEHVSADPRTGARYDYSRLADNRYRLCANFETNGPHEFVAFARPVLVNERFKRHVEPTGAEGSGTKCFELSIVEGN